MCRSYQYLCPLSLYMLVSFVIFKYILGWLHQHLPIQLPSNCQFLNLFLTIHLVQLPYPQSSILFQISQWYLIILPLNGQPNVTLYHLYLSNFFEETE